MLLKVTFGLSGNLSGCRKFRVFVTFREKERHIYSVPATWVGSSCLDRGCQWSARFY